MPSRSWVVCFRIKEHKVERDVPHLLLMTPAQVKEAGLSNSHIPALRVLSLLRRGKTNKQTVPSSTFWTRISHLFSFSSPEFGGSLHNAKKVMNWQSSTCLIARWNFCLHHVTETF